MGGGGEKGAGDASAPPPSSPRMQHLKAQPPKSLARAKSLKVCATTTTTASLAAAAVAADAKPPGGMLQRASSAPSSTLARKGSGPKAKPKRSRSGPKSKSSNFIGVSQYRRTGRWEAHIWDCGKAPGMKGRQLHLGSFDCAEDAARAYDRAVLHFRGRDADTNYPVDQYMHDPVLNALRKLSKEEFVVRLRGVAQHHKIQTQKRKEQLAMKGVELGAAAAAHIQNLAARQHAQHLHMNPADNPANQAHSPNSVLRNGQRVCGSFLAPASPHAHVYKGKVLRTMTEFGENRSLARAFSNPHEEGLGAKPPHPTLQVSSPSLLSLSSPSFPFPSFPSIAFADTHASSRAILSFSFLPSPLLPFLPFLSFPLFSSPSSPLLSSPSFSPFHSTLPLPTFSPHSHP